MKKIMEKMDYLWKGDSDMLITMWLSILLAVVVWIEVGFNIYLTFFSDH